MGEYFFDNHALAAIEQKGLRGLLTYKIWRAKTYENKKAKRDSSSVFWPSIMSAEVGFPDFDRLGHVLRNEREDNGGVDWDGIDRGLLERQLLWAGCKIVDSCASCSPGMRPMGYYNFGYGFGAVCSTFMNCPNNAPLAVWWSAKTQGIPEGWCPLLPRRTND